MPNVQASTTGEPVKLDLILGVVDNYTFFEMSVFLLSLRKTAFSGHLCLFAGPNIGRATVRRLRWFGAEIIRYGEAFPFVARSHADNLKWLPDPIHIYNFRHFLYLDYLLKHRGEFRNVLVTDVRDVVFQRDPFDQTVEDCIHVAMENPDITIGDCRWTSEWIVAGFGEAALGSVRKMPMSCAGTTLGPAGQMERYLRTLLTKVCEMRDAYEAADQAAHNLLLHEGRLAPVKCLPNFHGPILTVGTEPHHRLNAHRELINEDGSVINIVHQYDRHPELLRLFHSKVHPTAWRRTGARLGHRLEQQARRVATFGARLRARAAS